MAANPERGEVDVVIGERTYTLRPTMNAICAMQKRTGQTYTQTLSGLDIADFMALRELLFAYLQPYHGKEIATLEKAGDLIDAGGGYSVLVKKVIEVLRVNTPAEQAGGATDPQTTQAGTGDTSGATPDASA